MPTITTETFIEAPVEFCFDAARDIELQCSINASIRAHVVAGATTGLIGLGETVTVDFVHSGVKYRRTTKLTEFEKPHRFVDEAQEGSGYKSMKHIHEFIPMEGGTLMRDTVVWVSLYGVFGVIIDKLANKKQLRNSAIGHNAALKAAIEARYKTTI